jgi:hypothetical protein
VRRELLALAGSWRRVLAEDRTHARPIVAGLLRERVTITPTAKDRWTISGEGTLAGLFSRQLSVQGNDFPSGWRARRDSNPRPTGSKPAALSN